LGALSDVELVARAQAGDREAFGPLYRRYAGDVVRYVAARSPGRGWAFADDVAAETWATALRKIDKFSGMTHVNSFRGWLHGIAGHQMLQILDRADGREVATADEALERACDSAAPTPECGTVDEARRQALRARVYHAVAQLGPKQREVVRLRMAGLSPAEVAEQTGWTRRQVRSVWEHAKENLRTGLANNAAAPDDVVTRLRALDDMAADQDAGRCAGPLVERRTHAELRARVEQALAGLHSPRQREVVRLRMAGLSPAQVAEQTGWTRRQVNRCWTEGKRNLERALADTAPADTPETATTHHRQPTTDVVSDASADTEGVTGPDMHEPAPEVAWAGVDQADASRPMSAATAAPDADASPVDMQGLNVDDDAGTPDGAPGALASHAASTAADDDRGWQHERELVGAGVGVGDGCRNRGWVDDDVDGW